MDVIHFTRAAADQLSAFDAKGVSFVPLTEGNGASHVSCAHLEPGAKIEAPSLTHAAALLVVHGVITIETRSPHSRIQIRAGVGCVFKQAEPYSLRSELGAIILIVEAGELVPHARGISTPERIARAGWPSDRATTIGG